MPVQKKDDLEDWWRKLAVIPTTIDDDGLNVIAEDFWHWDKGTELEDIWQYFDDKHSNGVKCLMDNVV